MSTFEYLQHKRSLSSTPALAAPSLLRPSRQFTPLPTTIAKQNTPVTQAQSGHAVPLQFSIEHVPIFPPAKENNTALPNHLKAGVEDLSGLSMDDVQVHYNSSKPAEVQAVAYAQGRQIHIGPGQEKHLAHEAWHVVQQMQGRVKPTVQAEGTAIIDEWGLEKEADEMGIQAFHGALGKGHLNIGYTGDVGELANEELSRVTARQNAEGVVQRHPGDENLQGPHDVNAHHGFQNRANHRASAGVGGARMPLPGANRNAIRAQVEQLNIPAITFTKFAGPPPDTATTQRWQLVQTIDLTVIGHGAACIVVFDVHLVGGQMTGPGSIWVQGVPDSDIKPQDLANSDALYRHWKGGYDNHLW